MKCTFVINEIKKKCGNVEELSQIGWHFVYNTRHYVYMQSKRKDELHFSMPHVFDYSEYEINKLTKVINDTNLNVKFVKVVLLKSGSVSLDYYHKLLQGEQISNIVPHIIDALDFASNYLENKLKEL